MVVNTTDQEILRYNAIFWATLIPICGVENILCLFAVSSRKRWKSPDVLLFSFILAHFITLMIPLFMYTIVILLQRNWTGSTCKFLVWCVMSLRIVNSLQIAYVSMDRVWTLKWPGSYRIHNTAKQSARTAMFIWIFSLAIGTIPMLGWPTEDGNNFQHCSLILKVAGYGFAMCIVVIILGSFFFFFTCTITILFNALLRTETLEASLSTSVTKQIPEIVIESETGEKTAHVPIQRERQNKQICILVAAVVIIFYSVGDLPFVVINIMALLSNFDPVWMPILIMWSSLATLFLQPIMFGVLSSRYRRGYYQVFVNVGIGFGCVESLENENAMLHRQDTTDSLDVFDNDEEDDRICYPVPDPAGFGFTQSMELDDPPKYEVTPPIEGTRTNSQVVVRFQQSTGKSIYAGALEFDNIGFREEDEEEGSGVVDDALHDHRHKKHKLSSKERRAQFQALKTIRNEHRDKLNPDQKQNSKGHSANQSRNRHRKVERLSESKSRGNKRHIVRQNNVHTVQADVEKDSIVSSISSGVGDKYKATHRGDGKTKNKRTEDNQDVSSKKSSLPSPTSKSEKVSSTESALRSHGSGRYEAIRDKIMQEMSNVGSGELYDIPEDPAEDSLETNSSGPFNTFDGSLTSETDIQISGESLRLEELDVGKLRSIDSQETVPIVSSDDDERKRISFQFSMSGSDGGKSDNDSQYSFRAVGVGSIDYGKSHPNDNIIGLPNACPDPESSFDINFPDSVSSKSPSAKEMRKIYKNSKPGKSLLNSIQAENVQDGIVYL
ncbi:uncharacterized protein [Amphiura filiformis]|uniref:uncharacterized protein n=1 Tax=Amphiura filiformis TaxID=82378 RepID=UPI003B227FBB